MTEVSWTDVLSTSAVITTVLQFLTGSLVCHKYIQKKSTGDSSGFPFICGFLSCSLWLKYGTLTNEKTVILVNIIGAFLFISYVLVYYVFTVTKKSVLKQFGGASLVLGLASFYTQYESNAEVAIQTIGLLCCSVTVIFFAAPLTMLFHVIKVKHCDSLPFPLILASFFVSLQWFVYGVLIADSFIQIPNFLGCILSGAQLSLFIFYPNKPQYGPGPSYKILINQSV